MDENMPCSFCVPSCDGKEYNPAKEYCAGDSVKKYGFVTYKNKTYKTVEIGSLVWMAENINVVEGIKYNNSDNAADSLKCNKYDCDKYGRLYDWATAMQLPLKCSNISSTSSDADCKISTPHKGICPPGWHISRFFEWSELKKFVDSSFAGKNLKATKGWNSYNGKSGNGYDIYGFSALPGGYGYEKITPDIFDLPIFSGLSLPYKNVVGSMGYWWIVEDNTGAADSAYYSYMAFDRDEVFLDRRKKLYSHNVRCVRDN